MLIECSVLLVSFALTIYTTRKTIYISHKKNLFDEPGEARKLHKRRIPTLGGAALFSSTVLTITIFNQFFNNIDAPDTLISSTIILFFTGITDDLVGMNAMKKFGAQIVVSVILTSFGGLGITEMHGLFGIGELPPVTGTVLTSLFILVIINAYNLIDGINWLASGLGILAFITFTFLFHESGETGYMLLALAMTGALAGFMIFNRTPAKIFLGDSGSMFIGLVIAILSLKIVKTDWSNQSDPLAMQQKIPAIILSLLAIPMLDTTRVFFTRIVKGKSPFAADQNHFHHFFIQAGFTHMTATGAIMSLNLFGLIAAFVLDFPMTKLLLAVLAFSFSLYISAIYFLVNRKWKEELKAFEKVKTSESILTSARIRENRNGRLFRKENKKAKGLKNEDILSPQSNFN